MVLEEAPPAPAVSDSRPSQLLVLSARTASALDAASAGLAEYLKANRGLALADVLVEIPADTTEVKAGHTLRAIELDWEG